MTLTKADLIQVLYNQLGVPKIKSEQVVASLIEIIKKTLENGEDLLISGFGKLSVKQKKERRGRNPQTSEDLILKPRKVVVFKASGVLREKINS